MRHHGQELVRFSLTVPRLIIGGGVPTSKLTYIWPSRLKILKDEIRKPYFIKLKRFLWEQGVKAPNNSAKSLKIYPSRRYSFSVPWFHTLPGPNSSEHILVVEPHTTRSCKVVIIGQDPYHGPGQAHGMLSRPRCHRSPPSFQC